MHLDEVDEAARVLAEAFAGDALSLRILGDPRHPVPVMRPLFASVLRRHHLPRGAVDVAVDGSRIVGVAAWAAPGAHTMTLAQTWGFIRDTATTVGWRLGPLALHSARCERAHPRAPHWYLYALGVVDQGRGVGGRLLDHGIARAGSLPTYLEASTLDSARLYERKGFRRIGTAPTPAGLTPQPQMWRDPTPDRDTAGAVDRTSRPASAPGWPRQ